MTDLQVKPIIKSNIAVTGGSRDIGGGIVLELAKAGGKVLSVFRSKPERAQKIADEVKSSGGSAPILLQADLVTQEGKDLLFDAWKKEFNNEIDILVLCASGATMEINVDANMALVDKFLEIRSERMKKGEKLSEGRIIFLQSEPGHFQRVIDGVFDFIEYYRDKVGPAKRAGEDAFRERLDKMNEVGVLGIVVCPPEVTDTFNMKLFELQNKEARLKSRQLSRMLGTRDFVTIKEVAERVKKLVEDDEVLNGHTELFDGVSDALSELEKIYGREAVYVQTFSKTGERTGEGRLIVNPQIWRREQEPSFTGNIVEKGEEKLTASLKISKDHLAGHFRPELASVFPGHKSIRTAGVALGRFLNKDNSVDEKEIVVRKYKAVKFRGTVLPGNELMTKVSLVENGVESVTGDAVQSVDQKETMEIRGLVVEKSEGKSAVLLDQLIEAAAQAVGMFVLGGLKNEAVLPLFHSTGEAEIFSDAAAGENLLIKLGNARVIKTGNMNIFSGDVEVVRCIVEITGEKGNEAPKVTREDKIATIKSISGVLLPKDDVLNKLK